MAKFYINTVTHEIHKVSCTYTDLSNYPNVIYLGAYNSAIAAKKDAIRQGYKNADGCEKCSPETHTK